jgi:hypothetical protein
MVSWYSRIHTVALLITELFLTRLKEKKLQPKKMEQDHFLKNMIFDFSSTKKYSVTVLNWLVSMCKQNKKHRINQNGKAKLEKEFDVLKMIRHHRLLAC